MISSSHKGMVVAITVILFGTILSFFTNPLIVWVAIIALMLGGGLLGNPERMLLAYGVWAMVGPVLLQVAGGPVAYIDEALIAGCAATLIGMWVLRRRKDFKHKGFITVYGLLMLTVVVSFLFYRGSPISFVNVLFSYYAFPVILLLAYTCRSERNILVFIKTSAVFLLLQVVLNIGWIIGINPLPNRHAWVRNMSDICHGSIGRADWLAYASIALVFLFITTARYFPKGRLRTLSILLTVVAAIQFRFTFTNHALPYIVGCAGIYILMISRTIGSFVRYVVTGLVLVLILTFMAQAVKSSAVGVGGENISELFSKRNLDHRWRNFVRAPKMNLIKTVTLDWQHTHPRRWLIGLGPGNGTSTVGMTRVSPGAYELLADFYLTQTGEEERRGNSLLESTYSGLTAIWSEIGIIGYILFNALHWLLFFRVFRLVRQKRYTNLYQRILAEAFVPALFLFIISSFLNDLFWSDFWQVTIWVWAGFVFDPIPEIENDGENVQEIG